ncbi:hypothetical protein IU405_02200 [Polaribacter sp. BAL334]|uniref:DUF6371 domain-containing protein n=1 Tax=Polaribacter sp. BAL334 TaxID=1708178 RepID=UPI0018D26149|nr:DUF6371 domain-containing protein [Polaribacter sp. BAL334]MBG7611050.1 hypothetical protein [Polaribacter sp. BAL334]
MEHKYKLDRKRSRIQYCPCGKKNNDNKFVPFVDFDVKGHCFSCLKTFFPDSDFNDWNRDIPFIYKESKPISYHDPKLVSQSGRNFNENKFVQFLKSLFGVDATKVAIKKYLIGTSKKWKGATVFWQIDNEQKIRHGKIMLYNPFTGKRMYKNEIENKQPFISSVRAELKLANFQLKQCLFGLHLINETTDKIVAIVESEKTAILMSFFKPEYIWLATGSKGGFKFEYLKPLKDYKIIGFPDKSEYHFWLNTAIELNQIGFDIKINDWLEKTNYPKGTDFADVYIQEIPNEIKHNKPYKQSKTNKSTVNLIPTTTEKIIKKLAKRNTNIIHLIKIFQLTDENGIDIKV